MGTLEPAKTRAIWGNGTGGWLVFASGATTTNVTRAVALSPNWSETR